MMKLILPVNIKYHSTGLQNDHTALLRHIEEGLSVVLSPSASSNLDPNGTNTSSPTQTVEPFARVDRVMYGSPANMAVSQSFLSLYFIIYLLHQIFFFSFNALFTLSIHPICSIQGLSYTCVVLSPYLHFFSFSFS